MADGTLCRGRQGEPARELEEEKETGTDLRLSPCPSFSALPSLPFLFSSSLNSRGHREKQVSEQGKRGRRRRRKRKRPCSTNVLPLSPFLFIGRASHLRRVEDMDPRDPRDVFDRGELFPD